MDYEQTLMNKFGKLQAELAKVERDLDLLYLHDGLGWKVCPSSDSGLVELACWCAECKEYAKEIRNSIQLRAV
jgi:hypothetical protein